MAPESPDPKDTTQAPVTRWCRCGGGRWVVKKDANGDPIQAKDSAGADKVDEHDHPVPEFEWGDCPDAPTFYMTNWIKLPKGEQLEITDKTTDEEMRNIMSQMMGLRTVRTPEEEEGDDKKDKEGPVVPKWLTACPDNWEVPEDKMPADMGSFKGYTNKFTFSNVDDTTAHEDGKKVTFKNESADENGWDDVAHIGCIVGFGAFGLAILGVAGMIALDMMARMKMYDELIADDMSKMQAMGLSSKFREYEVELAARLAGGKEETGVDDQLVTQALELRHDEFAKYM